MIHFCLLKEPLSCHEVALGCGDFRLWSCKQDRHLTGRLIVSRTTAGSHAMPTTRARRAPQTCPISCVRRVVETFHESPGPWDFGDSSQVYVKCRSSSNKSCYTDRAPEEGGSVKSGPLMHFSDLVQRRWPQSIGQSFDDA